MATEQREKAMAGAVREVSVSTDPALPGADFVDSYEITLDDQELDAAAAARLAFARMPSWVSRLMHLRNVLVRPLGLKTAPDPTLGPDGSIGFFPVVSRTPDKVVLGLDDRHLDFRIVIDVAPSGAERGKVTATTFVKTHGALGVAYLNAILPFHRIIVPTLLGRLAKA
jgi:hypothetical protein